MATILQQARDLLEKARPSLEKHQQLAVRTNPFVQMGRLLQRTPDTTVNVPKPWGKRTPSRMQELSYKTSPIRALTPFLSSMPGEMARSWGRTMERGQTPVGQRTLGRGARELFSEKPGLHTLENPAVEFALDMSDVVPYLGMAKGGIKQTGRQLVQEGVEQSAKKGAKKLPKRIAGINIKNLALSDSEKQVFAGILKKTKPELEAVAGKTLKNKEVIEAAFLSEAYTKMVPREQTLDEAARILKLRQEVVKGAKEGGITPKFLEDLKVLKSYASDRGRQLQAFSIEAEQAGEALKSGVLKKVLEVTDDMDAVIKAGEGVNWENQVEVTKFYRKFVKPSAKEWFDWWRYNSMLSNPKTHMRNALSNLYQTVITVPSRMVAEGNIKGAVNYYGGAVGSLPVALQDALDASLGKYGFGKADVQSIAPSASKGARIYGAPSNVLEAGDRFFRNLIEGGLKAGGTKGDEAAKLAEEALFRMPFGQKDQGYIFRGMDRAVVALNTALDKVPGGKVVVPFIRTPYNFAKQWVEYSPLGFGTIPGAKNKKSQLAKAMIGTAAASYVWFNYASKGNTTWEAPRDPKEKEQFYAAGKKPYSIKIGGKWVPMMMFGPQAFSLAFPAALKYYSDEDPNAVTKEGVDKLTYALGKGSLGMLRMVSDQTFLSGMNTLFSALSGKEDYTLSSSLAYTAGQVNAWQGMQRYIATLIDPVYRKSSSFKEGLMKNIPGASKQLEPYREPSGKISTRETPAFAYELSTSKEGYDSLHRMRQEYLQYNKLVKEVKTTAEDDKGEAKTMLKSHKDRIVRGVKVKKLNERVNKITNARDKIVKSDLPEEKKERAYAKLEEKLFEVAKAYEALNKRP